MTRGIVNEKSEQVRDRVVELGEQCCGKEGE